MPERTNTKTVAELLMLVGEMLLENGAETFRVETSILNMFYALGGSGEINVVALGTQLTVDIFDAEHFVAVKRIRRRGINLEKLIRINDIAQKVSDKNIGAEEALSVLHNPEKIKTGNKVLQIFSASALVAGMFVFMIGGKTIEAVIAFVCCLLVQTGWLFVKRSAFHLFVANIASGFLTALLASAGALIWDGSVERIIFGAMLPLFPGVAMMIAIRDTVTGDITSGVVRGVEAVLTAVGLALGTFLGVMGLGIFGILVSSVPEEAIIGLPYAAFALLVSLGSGLMLNARIKTALTGAAIGGIVYFIFMLCSGTSAGVFAASFALMALSEIAARAAKIPSTVFLIIGVYPLVPGAGIYKTALLILHNNAPDALSTGNATMAELLFMIAGIAIVSVLFRDKVLKRV